MALIISARYMFQCCIESIRHRNLNISLLVIGCHCREVSPIGKETTALIVDSIPGQSWQTTWRCWQYEPALLCSCYLGLHPHTMLRCLMIKCFLSTLCIVYKFDNMQTVSSPWLSIAIGVGVCSALPFPRTNTLVIMLPKFSSIKLHLLTI